MVFDTSNRMGCIRLSYAERRCTVKCRRRHSLSTFFTFHHRITFFLSLWLVHTHIVLHTPNSVVSLLTLELEFFSSPFRAQHTCNRSHSSPLKMPLHAILVPTRPQRYKIKHYNVNSLWISTTNIYTEHIYILNAKDTLNLRDETRETVNDIIQAAMKLPSFRLLVLSTKIMLTRATKKMIITII